MLKENKLKFKLEQATKAQKKLYSFFNFGARWRLVVNATPRSLYPPPLRKTQYPLYRRLGGVPGPIWTCAEISHPPVFDPQTVHPVASSHTDCATPVHTMLKKTDAMC